MGINSYKKLKLMWCALIFSTVFSACAHSQSSVDKEFEVMSLSQFNSGRPSNFYFLAFGSDSSCDQLLSALNQPLMASEIVRNGSIYSQFLMSNKLIIAWQIIPTYEPVTGLSEFEARYSNIDLNSDGVVEQVIIRTSLRSSLATDYLYIGSESIVPENISELTVSQNQAISESDYVRNGQELNVKMSRALARDFDDYRYTNPNNISITTPFYEIVDIDGKMYLTITERNFWERRIDVIAFKFDENFEAIPSCRISNNYTISRH